MYNMHQANVINPNMNNFNPIHGYSLSKTGNASEGYAASQRQPSDGDPRFRCAYA